VVVAPAFDGTDFGDADLVRAEPAPPDVRAWLDRVDPALAVAATDDALVNDAVATAARDRGILLNRADRGGSGGPRGVVVPAMARDGRVIAAVATGGRAPVLSSILRADVERIVEGTGALADLLGDLRDDVGSAVSTHQRRERFEAVAESTAVREALEAGDVERARSRARAVLESFE